MFFRRKSKPKLRIVTAVWGEWHIEAHLRVNLPTLLAPGNLPALAAAYDLVIETYTRAEDLKRLQRAPMMRALRDHGTCRFTVLENEVLQDPIAAHKEAWTRALAKAKADDSWLMFMAPDAAWGDGSFASLVRAMAEGKTAIFMQYMRVVCPTFVADLWQRFGAGDRPLAIPCRELVRLGFAHLHPLMASYCRDSPYFPYHAEMMLWPVPGEGALVRVLAREMFLFHPNRVAMTGQLLLDRGFDPGAIKMMGESDEFFAVSLADLGKDLAWHERPATADPLGVGKWLLTFESPANDILADTPVCWRYAGPSPDRWQRRAAASALFLRKARLARETLRLWRGLLHLVNAGNPVYGAASVLSFALYARLLDRLPELRASLVLVPHDDAVCARGWMIKDNLARARHDRLVDLLCGHVIPLPQGPVPLHEKLAPRESVEAADLRGRTHTLSRDGGGALRLDGHALTPAEGFVTGRFLLYVVPVVLD